MERLIVKNFGAIKDVDIEIPRLLVFIGDQASGKSTLAKLIYIFKRTSAMISRFSSFPPKPPAGEDDIQKTISAALKLHFDTCFFRHDTRIEYHYSKGYIISIFVTAKNTIDVSISEDFRRALLDLNKEFLEYKSSKISSSDDKMPPSAEDINILSVMYERARKIRKNSGGESKFEYIRASRAEAAAPSLGLYTSSMDSSVTRQAINAFAELLNKSRDINAARESFAEDFKARLLPPKVFFDADTNSKALYEKSLREIDAKVNEKSIIYAQVVSLAYKLMGGYIEEKEEQGYGLTLSNDSSVFVPYFFLSSGQQSILPLIAGIALIGSTIWTPDDLPFNSAVLEEPEAHIYPRNQFNLMKLLAAALAINDHAKFIITTHSPYILSSINALAAYGLANGDVPALKKYDDLVPLLSDEENLGIYLLEDACAKSLRDDETGLFNTSEIDAISDEVGEVFDESVIAKEMNGEII